MPHPLPESKLIEEALEIIRSGFDDPEFDAAVALEAFRQKSHRHAAAVDQAESYWRLTGQLEQHNLGLIDRVRLRLEAGIAAVADYPAKTAIPACAALLIVVVLVGLGAPLDERRPAVAQEEKHLVHTLAMQTTRGQRKDMVLPDGSEVWLDWASEVEVSYSDFQRHIRLVRGKALFKVAADPSRPFQVQVDGVTAQALGTEYIVSRVASEVVEITVKEGKVEVSADTRQSQTRLLASDHLRVSFGDPGPIIHREPVEIGAWRDGLLVFKNRSLTDALQAIEPYSSYRLDIRQLREPFAPVSGTFFVAKADEALRALMRTYRLTSEIRDANTLILRQRKPQRPG